MAVWAVDIGNFSLKALHLSDSLGVIEVLGFEYIPHGKTLSGGNISQDEREELIALSLRESFWLLPAAASQTAQNCYDRKLKLSHHLCRYSFYLQIPAD